MKYNLPNCILRFATLAVVLIISSHTAWAGGSSSFSWFRFDADLVTEPTGAGKVYGHFATTSTNDASGQSPNNHVGTHKCDDKHDKPMPYDGDPMYLHLYAEPNPGFEFVRWEEDNDTTRRFFKITTKDTLARTATVYPFKPYRRCAETSEGTRDGSGHPESDQAFEAWRMAHGSETRYKAVFRLIETEPKVTVSINNDAYGSASITPAENDLGDEVIISTHTKTAADKGYRNRFLGWKRNGEYVYDGDEIFRETPHTFTITDDNSGEYTAVYRSGYDFFRVRNKKTNRWFTAVSSNVQGTGIQKLRNAIDSCLRLYNSFDDVVFDPGSIIEISTHKVKEVAPESFPNDGREFQDFHIQNISALSAGMYEFPSNGSAPAMLLLKLITERNTWAFETSTGIRFVDNAAVGADEGDPNFATDVVQETEWHLEGLDLDLNTKENYFSLIPSSVSLSESETDNVKQRMQDLQLKKDEVSGLYYTTLRVAWNLKYNTEQVAAYVITGISDDGLIEKTKIQGNIIPANTAVLLECQTEDVQANAMIPVLGNYSNVTANIGTNILVCTEKYFPCQNKPNNQQYKALSVVDGRVGFCRTVNATGDMSGNCGYLQSDNDVFLSSLYKPVTLAKLVEEGKENGMYEVTDLTWVSEASDNDTEQLVFCKDDNKYANPDKNNLAEDTMTDFMAMSGIGGKPAASYDESNWIALRVPRKFELTTDMSNAPLANVKGRYLNTVNPELLLTEQPTKRSESTKYEPNLYIPASFAGTQVSTVNQNTYFFVTPKPMEVANVKWAIWNGDEFITPPKTGSSNQFNLSGGFGFNQTYLDYLDKSFEGLDKYVGYEMLAVVKLAQQQGGNSAPRRAEGSKNYVAWPLAIQRDQQIITAVTDVVGKREVVSTLFYNVAGMPSLRPYDGLNIVVTRYSDGSTKTAKIVY